MLLTGSPQIDAERAFSRAARGRRRAALARLLRGRTATPPRLDVIDERCLRRWRQPPGRGVMEIPVAAINGTLEPSKAGQFDGEFRPAPIARDRWQRVWLAEHLGRALPPVSVVPFGDTYALRDGHHRVSVAVARGALTIDARIDAGV
jgi:hypothetical protein